MVNNFALTVHIYYYDLQRLQKYVDKNFSQYKFVKTTDMFCSIYEDVKITVAAEAIKHYTISSNPEIAIVS